MPPPVARELRIHVQVLCAPLYILVHVVGVLLEPVVGSLSESSSRPTPNARCEALGEGLDFGAQLSSPRHGQLGDVPAQQKAGSDESAARNEPPGAHCCSRSKQFVGEGLCSKGARKAKMSALGSESLQSELGSILLLSRKDMDPREGL